MRASVKQEAIYSEWQNSNDNLVIQSVAGSGN